uniref:Uncharacterized protein n=1 Tax=Romanomermis culicivorax TaxID=13658 RepID=A0A915IVW1_ROMCU
VEDDDNEVVTNADPKLFGTKPKSTELNDNSSSEISSKKSSKILLFRRLKEHEKYKYFSAYTLAKKLGEVESPEDFVSRGKNNSNDDLLTVPVACIYFNNGQFPNEKSMLNWIKAIDFGLEQRCITSYELSRAIASFVRLLKNYPRRPDKLLSAVGCDRLATWFRFALEENCDPSTHNKPIITVEINLDQPCSLEQATIDEVVNTAIKYFRFYAQLMEKPESLSIQDKRTISVSHSSIALLFCHWRVNDSRFWTDWFEFSMNRMFKINRMSYCLKAFRESTIICYIFVWLTSQGVKQECNNLKIFPAPGARNFFCSVTAL